MDSEFFCVGMKVLNIYDPNLGIGSIDTIPQPHVALVHFSNSPEPINFSLKAGVIRRVYLRTTDTCKRIVEEGSTTIRAYRLVENEEGELRSYEFLTSTGQSLLLREDEVSVLQGGFTPDPVENLANLRGGRPGRFYARLKFLKVIEQIHSEARGLVSIISARLKPYPHQAFVAATVLRDFRRRYMLADEVGLGKTIEAGLILQSLILTGKVSRVLIVAPGTIVQQWLCEMYIKFGRTVFTFLTADRLKTLGESWTKENLVICPTYLLEQSKSLRRQMRQSEWDIIIVDEVHRLIQNTDVYKTLCHVSKKVENLLLLSATPVEGSHQNFLQLLKLLDPPLFGALTPKEFADRSALQSEISDLLISTEAEPTDEWLLNRWREVLPGDETVARLTEEIKSDPTKAKELCHYIEDYYRLHRRILRNRRQSDFVTFPERSLEIHKMNSTTAEKSLYTELELLFQIYAQDPSEDILRWSHFLCLASSASPQILSKFICARLDAIGMDDPTQVSVNLEGILESALRFSWAEMTDEQDQLKRCLERARYVGQGPRDEHQARYRWLLEFLEQNEEEEEPLPKFILFTHFPLTAAHLTQDLREEYGDDSIAEFHDGLSPDERDREAVRFAKDPLCTLMISDELGGEGRNFQFARAIIHYDLPWEIFQLEQRIGRLDRLGREATVVSHVPIYENWVDEGLVAIYDQAIKIFKESAGGIEFIFNDVLRSSITAAVEGGSEKMIEAIPKIKETVFKEREDVSHQMFFDRSSYSPDDYPEFEEILDLEVSSDDLQQTFCRWAKKLGAFVSDQGNLVKVGTRNVTYPLQGPIRADILYKGTFDRSTAVKEENLDFFSIGHPLVSSFATAARSDYSSCALFQKRTGTNIDWTGFRFLIVYGYNEDLIDHQHSPSGLGNLGDAIFHRRIEELFVHLEENGETVVEEEAEIIESLRSPLGYGEESHVIPEEELNRIDLDQWRRICRRAENNAYEYVRLKYSVHQEHALTQCRDNFETDLLRLSVTASNAGETVDLDLERAIREEFLDNLKNLRARTLAVAYYEVS
jgi:ATP-dependent helicase HepA